MLRIKPSRCEVTGRDTVDCILEALSEICPRPLWLIRSALLPALVALLINQLPLSDVMATVWGVGAVWLVIGLSFIPCILAWTRIGFYSAALAPPLKLWDSRGVTRALDILGVTMLAVVGFAVLVDLGLRSLSDSGQAFFPAKWILVFASAAVVMPTLILGGVRLLMSLPAAALGWKLSYQAALELTKERSGWLAGIGVAFVCMFPLTWQGVKGLKGMILANLPGVPDAVWPWVYFLFTVLLCAVIGHGMGQVFRRLLDGVPDDTEDTNPDAVTG